MGRTIKRVPLDFDWPLNKVWPGFISPIVPPKCEACDGSGYSPEAKDISDSWYSFDDRYICVKQRCKRLGIDLDCKWCKGRGYVFFHPELEKLYQDESVKNVEPPKGEGYQLWETVSEGSPISPVFPTEESFVEWLIQEGRTEKAARAFVKAKWAPSAVIIGGILASDIDAHNLINE